MADLSTMNRENKKKQLRKQIVPSQPVPRPPSRTDEEEEEALRLHRKKIRRRRLVIALILLAVAGAAAFGWFYYIVPYQYTTFESAWETPMNEGSLVSYEPFGNNVLKVTRDGASYIDAKGKTIWSESYEMKNPRAAVRGDYAVIADIQSNQIFICDTAGSRGMAETILPVSKAVVSGTGVVAAVQEDATSSYITFFNKDGSQLDITVKTNMGGDGYPLDLALSEDGTQLLCSFVHIQGGELKNKVVFYDFSEIGKNVPSRVVGGFDQQFQGTIAGEVAFLGEPYSCAFSGNGLTFFSSKNLASPELITQIGVEEEIQSVLHSEDYAGMIVKNNEGEFENRMEIYKKDGSKAMSVDFTYDYAGADIDGDLVILYNENSCRVFNMSGVEKFQATFDFTVSRIRKGAMPNTLIVSGPQVMKEIRFR